MAHTSASSGTHVANKETHKSDETILQIKGQNADAESGWRSPVSKGDCREKARIFNYTELATATKNFLSSHDVCLGQGRFGSVFRGELSADVVLAVKKLNPLDLQSEDEFVAEVLWLSQLYHPNLVNLIGYCAEGNERLLVFQFMPLGSLERLLHDIPFDKQPLDWNTRMKIAAGVARGIDYLHHAEPSLIIGDLKPSNILLDEGFNPKLSDFGLAKVCRVTTKDMGTSIYRARECASTGKVIPKSDTYSFGVILLEIISGRKAYDDTRDPGKTSLVKWWQREPRPESSWETSYLKFADPKLNGEFPELDLCKVLELVSMCVRENAKARPSMKVVVATMDKVLKGGQSKR